LADDIKRENIIDALGTNAQIILDEADIADCDIEELIADKLSDAFGWLVNSFNYVVDTL